MSILWKLDGFNPSEYNPHHSESRLFLAQNWFPLMGKKLQVKVLTPKPLVSSHRWLKGVSAKWMSGVRAIAIIVFVLPSLPVLHGEEPANPTEASYFQDIRPILQRRCQACHQPASKQGELLLTDYQGFSQGGKSGPAFVPGDPEASLVVAHLTGNRDPRMPLGPSPLADSEIELFRCWIKDGAQDDTPMEVRAPTASGKPSVYQLPPVITALSYSPDGTLLAVSGYREVLLHSGDGSELDSRLLGNSDRIQSLAFSQDGTILMAGGGTPARFGEVQWWDVPSRKLKRSVTVCEDTVFGVALSPDASKVVLGCADNTVRILERVTGQELLKVRHHENWVLGTLFDMEGERIVSVSRDRAAKLTNASTGAFIENVNLLRGELTAIARHPSRDAVVIGGESRVPYYYSMDRLKKMKVADDSNFIREFDRQKGEIFAFAFSPDGKRLAAASAASEVPIYDVETGGQLASCQGHPGVYTLSFHPNGRQLATGGFDGRVRIYAVESGELLRDFIPVPIEKKFLSSN